MNYVDLCLFHFKSSRQKETSLQNHTGRAKASFIGWLKIIIAFHAEQCLCNLPFGNRCGKFNHFNFRQRLPKSSGYICVAAQDMLHVRFRAGNAMKFDPLRCRRKKKSRALAAQLPQTSGTQVHSSTTRTLIQNGLHLRVAVRKPLLRKRNKTKRLKYA